MIKYSGLVIFFLLASIHLKAQKGVNAISLQTEATIPVYQQDQGLGFSIKGLYGIGMHAQVTVSGGVSRFQLSNTIEKGQVITRLIPFLLGYKQNIHHFFIEPQIGLGELGGKIKTAGDYSRPSVAAVFGAIGIGYTIKRVNAGLRFQTAHGIEGNDAGTWHDKNFHYTAIYVGFNIFSKGVQ
ncbi:MAG: hypothetical protein ABIS01_06875 [Ferruginibacter sp.]